MIEMPLSEEAEFLLKKYFCACRRTKRTLFAYTELPATTTDVLYVHSFEISQIEF